MSTYQIRPHTNGERPVNNIPRYAKAVVGFIVPGAVILGSSVTSGSDGGSHITAAEWVTALVACVVTSGGVAVTRNADHASAQGD